MIALRILALSCFALASCVSQAKYDDALSTAQMYQRAAHDNDQYIAQLQGENQRLQQQLGAFEEGVVDASYAADIDDRLAALRGMLSGMGQSSDLVTTFVVDGGYGYSMESSVLFGSGSAEVSPEGRQVLAGLAKEIASGSFERIWIRGHTDSVPVKKPSTLERFPAGNLELSSARALGVAVLLAGQGLPMDRLAVAGLGASQPVADNSTDAGKAQNRRVEIFVIEDAALAAGN
jgi:flagellar motor protein MotB